jgi:hypothetical protein
MRALLRPRMVFALVLLSACADNDLKVRAIDAGLSDVSVPDLVADGPPDVAAPGLSDVAPTSCPTALSGTAPFGMMLSGTAVFARDFPPGVPPATHTMNVYIYFPKGRVAGAPVQLGVQSLAFPGQYLFGRPSTLEEDLSAPTFGVVGHSMAIWGDLLPGAGGLQATISANFTYPPSDMYDGRTGSMVMCPAGPVPEPMMQISGALASPLSSLSVNATTPIALDAIKGLRAASPLGDVALTVSSPVGDAEAVVPNFSLAAVSAFPPGQPLGFDGSAIKDVLGRPVPLVVESVPVLATSAVLSDLTFATTPPAGAVAASGCASTPFPSTDAGAALGMAMCTGGGRVSDGMLKVGEYSRQVDALLALPVPEASATKLRVRMAVGENCAYSSTRSGIAAVVGPHGESSAPVALTCTGALGEYVLALPRGEPLWLVVHIEGGMQNPYYSPAPYPPPVTIDELAFL